MSWTEERVGTLRIMWEEGHSASKIASALGEVTRNAVIGKVHRLRLSIASMHAINKKNKLRSGEQTAQQADVHDGRCDKEHAAPVAVPAAVESAKSSVESVETPVVEIVNEVIGCDLLSINDRVCKWPIGDPTDVNFYFCGKAIKRSAIPYCVEHALVAYQPASPKRDKRDRERILRSLS